MYLRPGIRLNKRLYITTLGFVLILIITWGCNNKKVTVQPQMEEVVIETPTDLTLQALDYADSVIISMTLEERVGQCLMPSISSRNDSSTISILRKYIKDYHVGGIVLMKGGLQDAAVLSEIAHKARVPLFVAIDAEWGLGMRLDSAPVYIKNGKIDKAMGENSIYDYGQQIAKECREIGINIVLGPVVDISSAREGVMANRSFGSDPDLVSAFGIAYAKGLESGGIMSVAKHFPGHGSVMEDSHVKVARLNKNIAGLDSTDLKPFKDYIEEGLSGIMAGHIQAPALDPGGSVATVSMDMLTSLLREEMGFKGLIFTDAFDMGGAKGLSVSDALKAGADIILCPSDLEKDYSGIMEDVRNGNLPLSIIDSHCRRILFYKYLFSVIPLQ